VKELEFCRLLLTTLWSHRDSTMSLHQWLTEMRRDLVGELIGESRTLAGEGIILDSFIQRTRPDGDVADMTLGLFSGFGEGNDRINLSTLHSFKGREFGIVVLFGMDNGQIPRRNVSGLGLRETRRVFYVGFARAETELHLMYTYTQPSPFVTQVQERLEDGT
jgi:DNA helicase-2/ATP-dependent DNA helicase PcrA